MHDDLTAPNPSHTTTHLNSSQPHLSSEISITARRAGLPAYGYLGIAVMFFGEILMFAQIEPVHSWFTAIQWTGYVLLLDAILARRRGESFIFDRTREFLFLLLVSNICWFLFEAYNLHLRNWEYHNLPENFALRLTGFFWAFATIFPGILMTSEVLDDLVFFKKAAFSPMRVPKWVHQLLLVTGALFCIVPIMVPAAIAKYLFVFVWVGYVFLLDPINYRLGMPSLLRDLEKGSVEKLLSLFLAGLICGILWEFWNYWAKAKWVYTVPYFNRPKIFEMPLYGFLGFLPFAVECFVMWQLALYFVKRKT